MFREFKVGDLLDVTQGRRLKKSDFQDGDIPFVMASSKNNGVVAYLSNPVTTNTNFITADILGNVFYHDDLVGFGDDNCGLKLKEGHESEAVYLYLVGAFSRFKSIASYGNKLRGKWYEEQFIQLPVKPGTDEVNYTEDDIDWNYMESYIHELEESYIQELDAYLKETGLDDYTLTDDEREVLEREPVFKEFEVTTLFDIVNTKSIRQSDVREQLQSNDGSIPYITASDKNNAIAAYIECPQEWIDKGNCIFIGGKTTTVTYQSQDFCSNDSHNLALYLKNEQARTEHVQLYLVSILKKAFANKYQWSNALSKTKIKNETIQLPVKPGTDDVNYTEDDIDWDYMTAYARVMEKLVIADVVDYKNEMIATTKGLIKN